MSSRDLPFREATVPGKGRGLLASRRLLPGQVLLFELPLLVGSLSLNPHLILQQYDRLARDKKEKIQQLTCVESSTKFDNIQQLTDQEKKVLKIFQANSISVGDGDMGGLYETISLLNHSCAPNVLWQQSATPLGMEVWVCREVVEGEELEASYCVFPSLPLRQARMDRLYKQRDFHCRCSVCSLSGEELQENENIRKRIQECTTEIPKLLQMSGPEEALNMAEKKIELMEEIEDQTVLRLPDCLLECHRLAAAAGDSGRMVELEARARTAAGVLGPGHLAQVCTQTGQVEVAPPAPLSWPEWGLELLIEGRFMSVLGPCLMLAIALVVLSECVLTHPELF